MNVSRVFLQPSLLRGMRHAGDSAANWYQALSSGSFWSCGTSCAEPHGWSDHGCACTMSRMSGDRHYSSRTEAAAASTNPTTSAQTQSVVWPPTPVSQGAEVLDGRRVAAQWVEELAAEVAAVTQCIQRQPGLAVVLVGSRPDSLLYVTRKREACEKAGVRVDIRHYDESVSQQTLEHEVVNICANPAMDGVLIQLPLAAHLDEEAVMERLDPRKDVDGFHPLNMGRMLMRGRAARLVPCTPLGIMELLQRSGVHIRGKSAVVVGDSNIVGTPLAALLRDRGASAVTVCHRNSYAEWCTDKSDVRHAPERAAADACLPRLPGPSSTAWAQATQHTGSQASYALPSSRIHDANAPGGPIANLLGGASAASAAAQPPPVNTVAMSQAGAKACGIQPDSSTQPFLPTITRGADLLVVAVGHAEMVKESWVKPGAVVIDVGINVVGIPRPGADTAAGSQSKQGGANDPCACTDQSKSQSSTSAQAAGAPQTFAAGTYHVVGDVAFPEVSRVAAAITPVPGGVGPMTIAAVLHNTLKAAKYNMGLLPW